MTRKTIREKSWYNYAVALCIAVVLLVALMNLDIVGKYLGTFIGFFEPVILGCVLAYIISPLANLYRNKLLRKVENKKMKNTAANVLAFATVIAFLVAALRVLIPQLIDSITMFVGNIDTYTAALMGLLDKLGASGSIPGLNGLMQNPDEVYGKITSYVTENADKIVTISASLGKGAFNWVIAFVLSIYILAERDALKKGFKYLLDSCMRKRTFNASIDFLKHCNAILNRYIVFNLIDAIIIGTLNLIFMTVMGIPYGGLVSFVVGLTNLIPTFGPFIGGAIGALLLVLVKPWYAGAFLLFTVFIQIFDGYILKPKLFGNSLGVSGLWILIAIIVGGNMFGVIGILLSIPTIAILDDVYHQYLIPALRRRKAIHEAEDSRRTI